MAQKNHNNLSVRQKQAVLQNQSDENNNSPTVTGTQTELQWINGPIPSAEELVKYEAVLPGSAERFLQIHERQIAIVEDQSHHRFTLERGVVFGDMKRSNLGLALGFIVCLAGMGMSYSLGMHGHDWLAGTSFVTEISGMAGLFIYGTNSRRAERNDRLQALLKEQNNNQPD